MPLMPIAKTGQISGIIRPNRPITSPQGHDRDKAGAAEEGQGIRQADIVEALVQHPDNYPGDHRPEDPGVDGLNTNHALNVVGLQHGGVGGRQYAFAVSQKLTARLMRQPAHKTGKRRDAFVLAGEAQRDCNTEHHGQETEQRSRLYSSR